MNTQIKKIEQQLSIGNLNAALLEIKLILAKEPNHPTATELLAYIYSAQGRTAEAHDLLLTICSLDNCTAEALYSLGSSFMAMGKLHNAIACFERALSIRGNFFEVLHDLGLALSFLGDWIKAIEFFTLALEINPNSFEVLTNLGNCYRNIRLFDKALSYQKQAINIFPSNSIGWLNYGVTLQDLTNVDDALHCFNKAIELQPNYLEAHINKGNLFKTLRMFEQSSLSYKNAYDIYSDDSFLLGMLVFSKTVIADWSGLDSFKNDLIAGISLNKPLAPPFTLLSVFDSPALHFKVANKWIADQYPESFALGPIQRGQNKKIRIGYFSADFKSHPVSFLIAKLFKMHGREKFEFFGFFLNKLSSQDPMTERLRDSFDHIVEVHSYSDIEVAKISREHGIDIAIDLGGHTQDSRTNIFANRAAAIQINYLGFPGTMGGDYYDYIIADKVLIPDEHKPFFSEKIIYMPQSYQVNDSGRIISDYQFTKSECGLPVEGFIFCCFNNSFKISPVIFDSWCRILKAVNGSVLWLYEDNVWAKNNLLKGARLRGISPDRIIFANRIEHSLHLARHRMADLFLDTTPYNAHTTASDALWSGLPILTILGESFAGRVAASLLSAIGLTELITYSHLSYESLAIELALNPEKLSAIKRKLDVNRVNSSLFNTSLYARNLEAAFLAIHQRSQSGLQPTDIQI